MKNIVNVFQENIDTIATWAKRTALVAGVGIGTTLAASEFNDPEKPIDWGNVGIGVAMAVAGGFIGKDSFKDTPKNDPSLLNYEEIEKQAKIDEAYNAQLGPNKFNREAIEKQLDPPKNTFRKDGPKQ